MTNRNNNCSVLIKALLIFSFSITACSNQTATNSSRTFRTTSIVPYSEDTITTSSSESVLSDPTIDSTSFSASDTSSIEIPDENDFTLSFCDNVLIADYGRTTANVYQAQYANLAESWGDNWFVSGYTQLKQWCNGNILSQDDSYYSLDRETARKNIENVHVVTLNKIEDYQELSEKLGISPDTSLLCWTYKVGDFPKGISNNSWFEAPIDIETINYAHLSAQYIDNLPVYGISWGIGFGYITYEWPGVVGPSRRADSGLPDSYRINPSKTCILGIEKGRFAVSDVLQSEMPVIDPMTCADEIKKAIKYDPNAATMSPPRSIWKMNVEVYCMELTYLALDPNPKDPDESEESRKLHNIFLVPVWQVYYVITDPTNQQTLANGGVLINAITGKSVCSDKYKAGENTYLYPEILLPG